MQRIEAFVADVDHGRGIVVPAGDQCHKAKGRKNGRGQRQNDRKEDAQLTRAVQIRRLKQRLGQALEERPEYHGVPRAAGDAGQNVDPDGIRQLIILGEDNVVRNHTGAEEHGEEDKDRDGPAEAEVASGKRIGCQCCDEAAENRADHSLKNGHAVGAQHARAAGECRLVRVERKITRQQGKAAGGQGLFAGERGGDNHDQWKHEAGAHQEEENIHKALERPVAAVLDFRIHKILPSA